jgi:hypothetical protein
MKIVFLFVPRLGIAGLPPPEFQEKRLVYCVQYLKWTFDLLRYEQLLSLA